jgi:MIP family channel proteins
VTITIDPQDWRKVLAEVVGTFFFFFLGIGGALVVGNAPIIAVGQFSGQVIGNVAALGTFYVALAHGVALALAISALGHISGAHFNPAVTIGILVARKIGPALALFYIVGQIIGGLLACLALIAILPENVWVGAHLGAPSVNTNFINMAGAIGLEAVLTFFLVTAVFGTAVDPRAPRVAGFGIGLTVFVDILVGGPLSGGVMNPARALAPEIVSGFWNDWYVYWIGPIIGAVVAALLYEYVWLPRADQPVVAVPPAPGEPAEPPATEPGLVKG